MRSLIQTWCGPIPARSDGAINLLGEDIAGFTGECPVAATRKMIICSYPFCNARVWARPPC